MATYTYRYTIGSVVTGPPDYTICPNGLATDRLENEIRDSSSITVALAGVMQDGNDVVIDFKAQLSTTEETALLMILNDHSGLPLPEPYTSEGIPLVALHGIDNRVQLVGTRGKEFVIVSHNFCDPTTWYFDSVRATEILTNPSGDGVTWVSVNKNWIDLWSGGINDEEQVVADQKANNASSPHGYYPVISVGGTVLSEAPRWSTGFSDGGDYVIDYANGTVTFASPPASAPQADYSYASGSSWVIAPKPGKKMTIVEARVQFSLDIVMNASIVQVVEVPDGSGGYIEISRTVYKSFLQFVTEAKSICPLIPVVAGDPAYRGTGGQQLVKMSFTYEAVKEMAYSTGARMRIFLAKETVSNGDTVTEASASPLGGTHASVTFAGVSEDE